MDKKLLVIGLDCAAPELLFERWIEKLPNIRGLIEGGTYGRLLSTDPPITIPAWASMTTGKDPGTLGFYGFRNIKKGSYDQIFATNLNVKEERIWDILSKNDKRSVVIGVPQTYPPKPINGLMVSSFLTPDKDSAYTYPKAFKYRLDKLAGGYIIDVDNFRTNNKEELLRAIYEMTNRRFKAVTALASEKNWDFFMFVEMGLDRIHHAFWNYLDPKHPMYEAGNPYENAIYDYYVHLDGLIGGVLGKLDSNTAVMVVSDHGAKAMVGGIAVNDWLIEKGYLVLKEKPMAIKMFTHDMVDWEKTTAWSSGGYCARIYINTKGREPLGKVLAKDYDKVCDKLIEELEGICDKDGKNIGTRALKSKTLYEKINNLAPDIIAYFGDLSWRSVGSVGYKDFHVYENDTGPDGANHDYHGVYIYKEKLSKRGMGVELSGLRIYDVASTILDYFGIVPPGEMIGKTLRSD